MWFPLAPFMAKHHNLCKGKNYRRAMRYQDDYIITKYADPTLLLDLRQRCVFRYYGLVPPNKKNLIGCVNTEPASHGNKLTKAEVDLGNSPWDEFMFHKGK
jgi:hypothetical protein